MRNYIDICRRISSAFLRIERELLVGDIPYPEERRHHAICESTLNGVNKLLKRRKAPPLSNNALLWIDRMWKYYSDHPEKLAHPLSGKRVTAAQIWDTVKNIAVEEYKIPDIESFRRGMHANRQRRYLA